MNIVLARSTTRGSLNRHRPVSNEIVVAQTTGLLAMPEETTPAMLCYKWRLLGKGGRERREKLDFKSDLTLHEQLLSSLAANRG